MHLIRAYRILQNPSPILLQIKQPLGREVKEGEIVTDPGRLTMLPPRQFECLTGGEGKIFEL